MKRLQWGRHAPPAREKVFNKKVCIRIPVFGVMVRGMSKRPTHRLSRAPFGGKGEILWMK